MKTRPIRWPEPALLALVTALTRFAFRSHYLYDIDSVNFALALDRLDRVPISLTRLVISCISVLAVSAV